MSWAPNLGKTDTMEKVPIVSDLHWRMYIQGMRSNSDEKKPHKTTNLLLNVSLKDEAGFQYIKQMYIDDI